MTAGRDPDDTGDADDELDDAPLGEAEAEAAAAFAGEPTDETLDGRIGTVVDGLADVTRTRDGDVEQLAVGGRVFARLGPGLLEVGLDAAIARAALATPDTRASTRGPGWVAFAPATRDRFALDRAEAWVRLAYRRAGGTTA